MSEQRIIVGSDHAGLELKKELLRTLAAWGWTAEDVGCHTAESVDYPDFAVAVGRKVGGGGGLGLLLCGSGIGMCIAANKLTGVRAALCHDSYCAQVARAHNNANVLCLGGRVVGPELAKAVLHTFLETPFDGGRHQRRLDKIARLDGDSER